jgi:hypothetical protein
MTPERTGGESIFEPGDPEVRRRQARSLLNDYSHPWDVLAEALQNSIDAVNKRYRQLIAVRLHMSQEAFELAIEQAAKRVTVDDQTTYESDYETWASSQYLEGQRKRWLEALASTASKPVERVRSAYDGAESEYKGKIAISRVDNARRITVEDNGVGMSYEELRKAVKKGVTFKGGFSDIGELGNGLTYLISACDTFELETCNGVECSSVRIEDMHAWITGSKDIPEPLSSPQRLDHVNDRYTRVAIEKIRAVDSDYPDLLNDVMTTKRFIHLIRTRTAVGHLYSLLRYPVYDGLRQGGVEVELQDTFLGSTCGKVIDFSYCSPAQIVRDLHGDAAPPLLSRDEAREMLRTHQEIGGHAIEYVGMFKSSSGIPLHYACFTTNREWYQEASKQAGLCDAPDAENDNEIGVKDVEPRVELAVKGMPTNATVSPPITGFQGYWGNFSIVIMDNRLHFDEGRKTPVGRRVKLYQDCAANALFEQIGTEIISHAIRDATVSMNLAEMMKSKLEFIDKRLRRREPLDYAKASLHYVPKYEQDVVALFHEMIGAGVLPYYHTLDCSSNSTYDSIFRYRIARNKLGSIAQQALGGRGELTEDIIVEFKHSGEDLIEDIGTNTKFYYMLDLLVCWDISRARCNELAATLITKPMNKVRYWGTTHELKLSSAHFMNVGSGREIDVISLKDLIGKLGAGQYIVS